MCSVHTQYTYSFAHKNFRLYRRRRIAHIERANKSALTQPHSPYTPEHTENKTSQMQTTAMLLRSSSTPLLEGLLAHTEPAPDHVRNEGTAGEVSYTPLCLISLHTCRGGSHLHPQMHLDSPAPKPAGLSSSSESPRGGLPSANRIRKVQSENDLPSLGGGGSVTPARVAANTFLQDSLVDDCPSGSAFDYTSSSYLPHLKKSRALQPLSRRRSLGSLPSELPSIFHNGDSSGNDLAILEEGESSPSCSSVASEVDEERETGTCLFDKIALPVGEAFGSKNDGDGVVLSYAHDHGKSSSGLLEKGILKGMTGGKREGSAVGLSQGDMIASSAGRQEPGTGLGQSSPMFEMARNRSAAIGATLVKGASETSSPLKYVYIGDDLGMSCDGGDGGGGVRPPTTTGGGGGGGDTGGLGGGGSDVADQHYIRVLQKDPGNPLLLRNYAQYLADVKHDYRKAEEFFQRAILANPSDGELLGQYAKMLWEVKHDSERAATYFERAVQAAPDNSYVMAAYASFLWSAEEEEQEGTGASSSNFPASFPSLVSAA